jgi:hypothetical protein
MQRARHRSGTVPRENSSARACRGLVSSHAFALFDYFRVPYRVEATDSQAVLGTLGDDDVRVLWPAEPDPSGARRGLWFLDGSRFFATVATDPQLREWECELGGRWEDVAEIRDGAQMRVSAVRRSTDGRLLLPFDPGDAMVSAWSESYARDTAVWRSRLKRVTMSGYYAVRPALPRSLQLALRRSFSRVQRGTSFPQWPVEPGLHDLYERLFAWLAEALGRPLAGLAPWPDGKQWALVLTHDVEHVEGYRSMTGLQTVERELGYRSAWYLVPERDYEVEDTVVAALQEDGFEVGVHGLRHDGRDLAQGFLSDRLGAIRAWGERWSAVGFRSPATHRDWDTMPALGFTYDSSSFDTDPFEPQSGGCCTWLPFHNRQLVELPLTLTMDHTIFEILRQEGPVWVKKTDYLRRRGGMALLLTHPDYMLDDARREAYARFLRRYADDPTAWHALPVEVAAWWNRRAESSIDEGASGRLSVTGPAAGEARIVLLGRDGR